MGPWITLCGAPLSCRYKVLTIVGLFGDALKCSTDMMEFSLYIDFKATIMVKKKKVRNFSLELKTKTQKTNGSSKVALRHRSTGIESKQEVFFL